MSSKKLKLEKKETRKEILAMRDAMPLDEREHASREAEELLFGLNLFSQAGTVMFFVSFRSEISTEGMIRRALDEGKRVVVPITQRDSGTLLASELEDYDIDLSPGSFGIPEPRGVAVRPADPAEIDFLLLPGAAFDVQGNRIGYGGGYYDRFIETLPPGTPLAALAFSNQIIEKVPVEPHDKKVEYIITEEEIIDCEE